MINTEPNIKSYREFKVQGISTELSEEEKQHLILLDHSYIKLKERKDHLLQIIENLKVIKFSTTKEGNMIRPSFLIDLDYSPQLVGKIFDIKNRRADHPTIYFKNDKKSKCFIKEVLKDPVTGEYKLVQNSPILLISFIYYETKMTVNRFLDLYAKGDFSNITPKEFAETYLIPGIKSNVYKKYEEQVFTINTRLKELENDRNIYESKFNLSKHKINSTYMNTLQNYTPLIKESKERSNIIKSIKQAKSKDLNLFNTLITKSDEAYFMGWLCKHIYSIRSYVLKGGMSESLMDREDAFPDNIYGKKRRTEPKYDSEHKLISSDTIGGYLSFDTSKNAPLDIILKLTQKTKTEDIFKGNRINDLNLSLFILSQYNSYGFKVGQINLHNIIDYKKLRNDQFSNYATEFDKGFSL